MNNGFLIAYRQNIADCLKMIFRTIGTVFVLPQYVYGLSNKVVTAEESDTVIDARGRCRDNALYFILNKRFCLPIERYVFFHEVNDEY